MMSTSFDLHKIKLINQNVQFIIFGYCRESQKALKINENNQYHDIPDLICYICLMYYHVNEYWTEYGYGIKCDESLKTITNTNGEFSTAYGYQPISIHENINYFKWELEVINNRSDKICIGIDCSDKKWINDDFGYKSEKYCGYGESMTFSTRDEFKPDDLHFGRILHSDDKFIMEVNLKTNVITFSHKGQKFTHTVLENAFTNNVFYLAVYLCDKGDSVQITNFDFE